MSQVIWTGALPSYYGIAEDTEEDTYHKINKALSENDVIILSGGVSVGEFDFVADVLVRIGFKILFNRISVTPGKPTTFGKKERQFCFGLPGNPVSSFVQFELMVKPFLFGLQGHKYRASEIKLPMAEDYSRKNTKNRSFNPVIIKKGEIYPLEYHGSGHIHSLSNANGLISFPIGTSILKKGELIDVRQI
jgi:molybdopterin molybdotransferase